MGIKSSVSFRAKRGISRLNIYWVYILASKTGTLCVGVTNDLRKRVFEHKNKMIPGFTSRYNIDRLMYFEEFSEIDDAITMEKKIKGWTRQKKINLIRTKNPEIKDLGENLEILHFVQDDKLENHSSLIVNHLKNG